MTTVATFPRAIERLDPVWIPLTDGTRLAARVWLPVDAERSPVPAILEYLPYRRRDFTAQRDALTHPYVAGHGYACVRVDMRGSGDSDGVLTDEYLPLEQDDAVEVIAWLAAQPWCTGAVGMMGHSWGGFNALQVAARRPPALRAIITSCSTDDRYADDIHYMGGALLLDNLRWASTMFAHNSRPPGPGGRRRPLARDVARAPPRERPLDRHVAPSPAARRLLEAGVRVRGLRRDPVPGPRGGRLAGRLLERDPAPDARGSPGRATGSSASGRTAIRTWRCPGRRWASSSSPSAGGTRWLKGAAAERRLTSPCSGS